MFSILFSIQLFSRLYLGLTHHLCWPLIFNTLQFYFFLFFEYFTKLILQILIILITAYKFFWSLKHTLSNVISLIPRLLPLLYILLIYKCKFYHCLSKFIIFTQSYNFNFIYNHLYVITIIRSKTILLLIYFYVITIIGI